ncbi:MAG: exopolysaccharide biosynthesis polyprenyl glycosylphosphotransferase [Lachnospiraceae bacterium]|nr:exopolysaccharide biosynthesis polyprenyl glycosylphosphotransferase [Lachnospiraceae bacterium]
MNKNNAKYWYRGFSNVAIVLLLTIEYSYMWRDKINILLLRPFENKGNLLVYVIYIILCIMVIKTFDGFKMGVNRISHIIISQWVSMVIVNGIIFLVNFLMVGYIDKLIYIIPAFIALIIIQSVTIFFVTYILTKLYRSIFPPLKMLMIYGKYTNNLAKKMNGRKDKYIIADRISEDNSIEVIAETMRNYDAIVLNDIETDNKNHILKEAYNQRKRVYFTPKISDILVKNADELHLFDTPLYLCRNLGLTSSQRFVKRTMDIVISLVGIIISSPIMLVATVAIKANDGGPVIYKQKRATIDDREFYIMKFRSMVVNAESDGKARLAGENDDRITSVGKVIRATRIDELPQFFNVLKGDMSIVGPRPERPEIIAEYVKEVPEFAYRTRVKAGLTGYAQVYGKYNTTNLDKLKLDMIYVERGSILLDIKLILLTIKVIFIKDSTEGLEDGEEKALTGNGEKE